ncbi:MAG TPA: ABC transporter permease [Candidatus Dormibacteraeota bacterium]
MAWRRFRRNRLGLYSGALLLIMIAVALAAPVISAFVTHQTATGQDLNSVLANPSAQHWLGSDELGRDTLTRLAYGAQASLGVGVLTVAIVLAIGVPTGLAAGYLGGIVDDVLMRVVDVVLSTPAIFLYILMSILFRPNPILLAFIIASLSWAPVSRLVRAEAISLRDRDFMVATRAMGATNFRLVLRHLLPNTMPVIIVNASLRLGQVVLIEAALDFLGLGIQPPTASWGNMLSNAELYFSHSIWLVLLPGALIFATVMAANLLGDALRDTFDPWVVK